MKNASVSLINETCHVVHEQLGKDLFCGDCGIFALALIDTFSRNNNKVRLVEVPRHFAAKFGNFVFDGNGLIDEESLINTWAKPIRYHKVNKNSLNYIYEKTYAITDYEEMMDIIYDAKELAAGRLRRKRT
jgi:hypothetical protein